MPAAAPELEPGRVYRTREFAKWGGKPSRVAKRLVERGELVQLSRGLFAHPKQTRFGPAPPRDEELMRAFLDGGSFVFTGPERWNALGLGTTAMSAVPLVYNTNRSGTFTFGNRRFTLRRVAFPESPPAEWFVVDLLEHAHLVASTPAEVAMMLARALSLGRFEIGRLREMAEGYGSRTIRALVDEAIRDAAR